MPNDTLRAALRAAGLQPDELAGLVEVDVRTVRRWLAGRAPYARHRATIARALDRPEHELWPDLRQAAPAAAAAAAAEPEPRGAGEPVTAYADDPAAPTLDALIAAATERVDLADPDLSRPGLVDLLAARAAAGCAIRILLSAVVDHPAALTDHPEVAIRVTHAPVHPAIDRVDGDMLVGLHAGADGDRAIVLVRQATAPALFARLSDDYDRAWAAAEIHSPTRPPTLDDQSAAPVSESLLGPLDGPRRWPRRPT